MATHKVCAMSIERMPKQERPQGSLSYLYKWQVWPAHDKQHTAKQRQPAERHLRRLPANRDSHHVSGKAWNKQAIPFSRVYQASCGDDIGEFSICQTSKQPNHVGKVKLPHQTMISAALSRRCGWHTVRFLLAFWDRR